MERFYNTTVRRRGEACQFDRIASDFLTDAGFVLSNDCSEITSPYMGNEALYASARGFYLSAGFDPLDGNSAAFYCGRLWTTGSKSIGLSGSYSELARNYGVDLPPWYQLGFGDRVAVTLTAMLQDLKDSLPIVMSKLCLIDLKRLERGDKGVARRVEAIRSSFSGHRFAVSDFR